MARREKEKLTPAQQMWNQRHASYLSAFNFAATDLQANEAGVLSPKQNVDKTTLLVLQLLLGLPLYSFLALAILRNGFGLTIDEWIAGLLGMAGTSSTFAVAWIMLAVGAVLISSFWWLPRIQDYRAGRVLSVDGKPTDARPSPWNPLQLFLYLPLRGRRRNHRVINFRVGDIPMHLTQAQFELIDSSKKPHTFYYLPRSKQVVAVVPRL
jgi:hypothetical protein